MKRLKLATLLVTVAAVGLWYWTAGGAGSKSAAGFKLPTPQQIDRIKSEKGLRASASELKKMANAAVARVVDGDTLELQVARKTLKVRLLNVDTPETVDPRRPVQTFGKEASDFAKSLLPPGTKVYYRYDVDQQDRYGRDLVHLYLSDGSWVNALLIRAGYAQLMTVAPNVEAADFFRKLQAQARDEGVGLWQVPQYRDAKKK